MAVPPDLIGFVESAGLAAVACGVEMQALLRAQRKFSTCLFRNCWRIPDLIRLGREGGELITRCCAEMSTTLMSLADEADLLITSMMFDQTAANIAEYYDVPLAMLHYFPIRPNGHFVPMLPAPLGRAGMTLYEWLSWRMTKQPEDARRRELRLPKATGPTRRRVTERGSLEIQAYDEVCFPGLAREWAKCNDRRPFVGALTMELPTDADEEVGSWIAAGTPPIFFGFGSMPIESPADTLAMISAACTELGERALVCSGWSDFSNVPHFEHVKVVTTMNYAAVFPACRAVVHHGGSGTTAAALRAGVPQLILWMDLLQAILAPQVQRLKVGAARRFSSVTQQSLAAELRNILAPQYDARAHEIASRMTKPAESVAAAADLVEGLASRRRVG
ncbi:putative glycosyltransferase/ rhamnosyltransferase [Mycobacterium noviomagense]|nr:putative glycosyltransferase/ rhamnosyltransferase [Mycobacterium noviomagense]